MKKMKDLESWLEEYEKYRDCFQKKLGNVEKEDGKVLLHYENSVVTVFCEEDLSDLEGLEADKIATLNTTNNLEWVIHNWEDLVEEGVMLYFVNLDTKNNWVLKPRLHSKITPQKHLKKSLQTLFQTVKEA